LERAWVGLAIFGTLVVLLTSQIMHPVAAVFTCALAMVLSRCVTGTVARASINLQVLIVIGSALGLGTALTETGAAQAIADLMLNACEVLGTREHPGLMLLVLFIITVVFSQLITNNGAAVLMFPITMATAQELAVSPVPFIFSLMVAAGCSFLSPVGYQTNLMVYGPGGYRFLDYARLGLPLTIVVGLITVIVSQLVFPFHPGAAG
jgi:di/tricarboxylate transporter